MIIIVIFIIFSTAGFSKVLDKNSYNIFGSSRKTIYVDDDGTVDYIKIQQAIDNASFGDTIFVYDGVYNETIIVDNTNIT